MTQSRPPIRSIAILGAGLVGLSAALAFGRALPGVSVTVLATPPDPAALADRLPGTLPGIADMLPAMGIDEAMLVARGAATHRLGQVFEHWREDDAEWVHAYGETGAPMDGVAFHQRWLRARRAGAPLPFHRYGPAATLAQAGRFVHPVDDPRSPLSRIDYALRLDPARAGVIFAERAQRLGVRIVPAVLRAVDRTADGGMAALRLDGDRTVTADLFIDCSGPAAPLLADRGFESWSDALPVDRLLLTATPLATPSPQDHYTANASGWRGWWPLRDRALVGLAYTDGVTSEARARRVFGEAGRQAEAIALRPGRVCAPWQHNVLALGDAAVASGPLEWTGLTLAHAGIALALELLPGRDFHPLELAEYNRRAELRAGRVRDFLALHYQAGARRKGELWQTIRNRAPPPDLARTLARFAQRGVLPHFEEESFDRHSWLSTLIGLGVTPTYDDPAAMSIDPADGAAGLTALAATLATLPARLPSYPDYLVGMARRT